MLCKNAKYVVQIFLATIAVQHQFYRWDDYLLSFFHIYVIGAVFRASMWISVSEKKWPEGMMSFLQLWVFGDSTQSFVDIDS